MSREIIHTYTLTKPVKISEHESIESVSFFEPTAREMRSLPSGTPNMDEILKLCVKCTDILSDNVMDKFCVTDATAIMELTMGFFVSGTSEATS